MTEELEQELRDNFKLLADVQANAFIKALAIVEQSMDKAKVPEDQKPVVLKQVIDDSMQTVKDSVLALAEQMTKEKIK